MRSIITDDPEFGGFRITIPATEGSGCPFGCVVALWAFVEVLGVLYTFSGPDRFSWGAIALLVVWAAIGLVIVYSGAYARVLREIVMIDGKTLVLRTECAGHSCDRKFDLAEVRNLRPDHVGDFSERRNMVGFDHGGGRYGFGVGLSEHEIVRLVKTIQLRFPIRDDWTDAEPLPIIT
jgi:hypothetical protein